MDLLKQRHKNVLCLGAKRTSGIVPFWLQLHLQTGKMQVKHNVASFVIILFLPFLS